MPVRRSTDPKPLQYVWDAIRSANSQKQMADFQRIIKYLQRNDYCTTAQAELYLKQSLEDGLVLNLNKTTVKGAKVGLQVESYKIPNYELPLLLDDGKDWYCIDCHLAGDVIECRVCFRVYHMECANKKQNIYIRNGTVGSKEVSIDLKGINDVIDITNDNDAPVNNNKHNKVDKQSDNETSATNYISLLMREENQTEYDSSLCSICNMCKLEPRSNIDKEELNYLLSFVHTRIKAWLPASITDSMSMEPKPEWMNDVEINWRVKQLFRTPMNMIVIENKIKQKQYEYLVAFKADVLTIQHNVAIYHGIESQEYGASEYMLEDCRHDLVELSNCLDCYKHSNEKINNKWFCLPCRVPHKLVWAKQKGYPYWPAKVLKETEDTCDVRFFGGKYERSILQKIYIKPITMKVNDVQAKKGSAFNKAVGELLLHQKMLSNPNDLSLLTKVDRKKKSLNSSETALPIVKVMQLDTGKKQNVTIDLSKSDDIFEQSAQALEDSFIAQASVTHKRKRSQSPTNKANKVNHTPSNQNRAKRTHSSRSQSKSSSNSATIPPDMEEPEKVDSDEDCLLTKDNSHEEVTSSTEQMVTNEENSSRDNSDGPVMPEPDRQYSESVEKTRRKLEQCHYKKQLINIALECMQAEIDRINSSHDEYVKKLFDVHNTQVSETKKKQWCYNCEQEAIYHCCWNTAYCSPICQQQHWQTEHKKVCRRKR
uniref:MYND-type domain-containing protein n=2 Tax=Photinus pyralis TaxID=7054 RepID=A0A1Y1N527_PHOPY